MEIINGVEVEAGGINDDRYCLEANNLSDIDDAATAFDNIKQVATNSTAGVSELATDAETVTGTATNRVATPANITAKMAAPGSIGETTPAAGVFTTLEATGQLQGALINNQMVSKVTFDILGLMTDPRFLNIQCEDPGAGTMVDVSGQGHNGTYQGSMTTGDRVKKGMGWSIDYNGDSDYVDIGDSDDFSFGDGSNDEAATWFGVVEIIDIASTQTLFSKVDETTGLELREYRVYINSDRKLGCVFYDESANTSCYSISNNPLSVEWHSWAVSYDGAGGSTAANTIYIYVDGSLVASTATNSGSYTAMENLTTSCWLGAWKGPNGAPKSFIRGDSAITGIDGSEWSAFDVHKFHQLCKGLYGI